MFAYKMYTTFQQTFAYKMYIKCLYTKYIPHFNKLVHTFCIHQLYTSCPISVYKMYTQLPCEINFKTIQNFRFLKTCLSHCEIMILQLKTFSNIP